MRRYEGLTAYLLDRKEPVEEVSFAELDALVEGGLPPSARRHPAWWANSRQAHSHARYWLDAGRQAVPDMNGGRVRFPFGSERRIGPHGSPQRVAYRPISSDSIPAPSVEGEALSPDLQVDWVRLGPVRVEFDHPVIPPAPARPGVYRFTLVVAGSDVMVYVGESDNLLQRMGGYRNPGPTQATNRRIHARIVETIGLGGSVDLAVSTRAVLDGEVLNLAHRPARLLVENAMLVDLDRRGVTIENL